MTCGVQSSETEHPPNAGVICEDERQYVRWEGQRWTTLNEMQAQGYRNEFHEEEHSLTSLVTVPEFAIGQRSFLVQTPSGNLLWDCIAYLDENTVKAIRTLGGVQAIAISHPHYYSSMVEWSEAFDAPVYLNAADRKWVMHSSPRIRFWEGDSTKPLPDVQLVRLGGHFDGGTVCHWPRGADARGVLLSGDIITVVMDRGWVSFMYSYPNQIPLSSTSVERIAAAINRYPYDRIYSAFTGRQILAGASEAVRRSAKRYIGHLQNAS